MFCYITGERRRKMRKKKKEEEEEEKEKDEEEEERWGRKRRRTTTITTTTRWGEEDKSVSQLSPDTKRNVSIFLPTAGKTIHQSEPEVGLRWGSDVSYTTWQQRPCVTWTNVTHWSEPEPDARLFQTEPPRGWMTAVHIRTEAERSCCREKYFRSNKHSPCSDPARCHMDPSARRCRLHQFIQAESDQSVRHRALKLVRLHKHRVSFSLSSERRPSSPAERLNNVFTQQFKVQLLLHFTQL